MGQHIGEASPSIPFMVAGIIDRLCVLDTILNITDEYLLDSMDSNRDF